jgi:predicted RNA-binding protein with PUA-like domain
MAVRYWLMKSEPDVFSIDDLARDNVTPWEGVRSYQARNLLRDELHVGDGVLFYHSSTQPPGVAGIAEVVHESYPDRTAFDPKSTYFDPKSTNDDPRWFVVDVRFVERFPAVVPLAVLHATPGLEDMVVTRKGMRLSVQPVTEEEWRIVVALGRATEAAPPAPAQHKPTPRPAGKGKATSATAKGKAPSATTPVTKGKATAAKGKAPAAKATAAKTPVTQSKAPAAKGKAPAAKTTAARAKATSARTRRPAARG